MSYFNEINQELNNKRDNTSIRGGYCVIKDKDGKTVDLLRKSTVQFVKINQNPTRVK